MKATRLEKIIETAPFVEEITNDERGSVSLEVVEATTDYSDSNTYVETYGPNKEFATMAEAKAGLVKYIQARTEATREQDPEWHAFDATGNCF